MVLVEPTTVSGHVLVELVVTVVVGASEAAGSASEAEDDAELVDSAEAEAEDKAGAASEAMTEPKSAAGPGFAEPAYETSSEAAGAWKSGVSPGAVMEPRAGPVAASEAEDKTVSCEEGDLTEGRDGDQLEATLMEQGLLNKPETVAIDPFAEGTVEAVGASAGDPA